ncbi:MAG TPA: transporter substrate-binding domain-containing protein [Pseudomonas sp.]|jgi:polar amino acid transport system substrate-binding protein
MSSRLIQKLLVSAAAAFTLTSALAAQVTVDEKIRVPAAIKAAKVLKIALFAGFPPMASKVPETGELVGIDVDLANYVGKRLGVAIEWEDVSYESAINSLMTGRVDMAFSLLNAPEAADRLDYLPYLTSGMQPYTLATHAPIATAFDICGLKVGANRRNAFDAAMKQWSDTHCVAKGKPAIEVHSTDGTAMARLDLKQARVDVAVQSSESVPATMALEKDTYVTIGKPLSSLFIVAGFPKQSAELRDAVSAALQDAVADGSYALMLARYGLTDNTAAAAIKGQ